MRVLALLLALCGSMPCLAGSVAIVVRADSPLKALTRDEANALFVLDQRRGFVTYDLPDSDPARESLYLHLAGKNLTMMRGMRARLVFSGQIRPPQQLPRGELVQRLLADPRAVGYLPIDEVPPGLRVVLPLRDIP